MDRHTRIPRLSFRAGRWEEGTRAVPAEVPVALVYNGTTQAVMMATPADLEDFAAGFSISEQIVTDLSEIQDQEIATGPAGIEIRMWLKDAAGERFHARRRAQVGPVGCGLCGIDSLAEALRPLPAVPAGPSLTPSDVEQAMQGLIRHQALNHATRAVHAAGFYLPGIGVTLVREDVGRHNAFDKLGGALARAGTDRSAGAAVLTSRVSLDMVQKAAILGIPAIFAASAPTARAVDTAEAAGITLVAVARGAEFELFTHPERFTRTPNADVA
jgi:FdhD protein